MDRRSFLRLLGLGAASAAAAPLVGESTLADSPAKPSESQSCGPERTCRCGGRCGGADVTMDELLQRKIGEAKRRLSDQMAASLHRGYYEPIKIEWRDA